MEFAEETYIEGRGAVGVYVSNGPLTVVWVGGVEIMD